MAQKRLGVRIGVIAVLHTWGQNLMDHPHIHCLVTGGGLTVTGWRSSKRRFLLPVKVMSRLFRGKFISFLKKAKLGFPGTIAPLKEAYARFLKGLYAREWVVYCKPPFHGPESVIQYLGRYTHRVAITNHRLIAWMEGRYPLPGRTMSMGTAEK
ncbi:MAG: putative transposase [Syntrophorhabdus sp. PtaU1.Bin002]|nr:MAG: putative transposase [Syntrophorhabdus sp. PtaB.Bin006]OPY73903.1 MAG: putative transposase [Syntrophorhabdus sp. PtaU1.Bin002]